MNLERRKNIKKVVITTVGIISFGLLGDKFLPKEFKKDYFPPKENTIKDNQGNIMVTFS